MSGMGIDDVWEQFWDQPRPHASLQWKGTDVCMDVYCECGAQGHIDDDFVYYVRCTKCGAVFACNPNIALVKLTDDQIKCITDPYVGGIMKDFGPEQWEIELYGEDA